MNRSILPECQGLQSMAVRLLRLLGPWGLLIVPVVALLAWGTSLTKAEVESDEPELIPVEEPTVGSLEPGLQGLVAKLNHDSPLKRREAILKLTDAGLDRRLLAPCFWPLMQDDDLLVRAQAARGVWIVGHYTDVATFTLLELLIPSQPQVCAQAAFLIGEIGPEAAAALPALRACLEDRDPLIRLHAAEAILKIEPADLNAHAALLKALRHTEADVRYFAACALLSAAPALHAPTRRALMETLGDDDLRVSSASALALQNMAEKSIAPTGTVEINDPATQAELNRLVARLTDPSPDVRQQAATQLADRRIPAQALVPALRARIDDADPIVRAYVAHALWNAAQPAELIVPRLVDLLGTYRPNVTTLATTVLAEMGPEAADALPTLYDLLDTGDPLVRLHVATAISRIDPRGRDAIATLGEALHDSDSDIRYLAALSLGHVSLLSRKRAERELEQAQHDRNLRVRSAAKYSLERLHVAAAKARPMAAAVHREPTPQADANQVPKHRPPKITHVSGELDSDLDLLQGDDAAADAISTDDLLNPPSQTRTDPQGMKVLGDGTDETPEEHKRLSDIRARISFPTGQGIRVPENIAARQLASTPVYHLAGTTRGWYGTAKAWEPTGLCHNPLYFQDLNLERYGYHYGCAQTVVSSVKFATDTALLPYKMCVEPVCSCVYTLGYDRPGNCVPYRCYRLPWRTDAALLMGGLVTGLVFLAPP
ncbi:MAG: HEAT repeat domain-containing protein [Planctomycetales bacterium]